MLKNTTLAIDFIDLLFAIVVGIGFEEIMGRVWFEVFDFNPRVAFEILALFLAYTTVILSWYGYHRSVSERPIQLQSKAGIVRFLADISLLILYWLLLVKSENLWFILLVLVVIWIFYVIWDQLELLEYKRQLVNYIFTYRQKHFATIVSLICLSLLFALYTFFWGINKGHALDIWHWVFAILALAVVIGYRTAKKGYG